MVIDKTSVTGLAQVEQVLQEAGLVGGKSGRYCSDATGLFREAGCKEQKVHTDYVSERVAERPPGSPKPRTAWVVLQKGAKLVLGMLPSEVTLELKPDFLHVGDIVIFDGDIPHAGSAYSKPNIGLHVYLDVPGVARERDPNKKGSFQPLMGAFAYRAVSNEALQEESSVQEQEAAAAPKQRLRRRSARS